MHAKAIEIINSEPDAAKKDLEKALGILNNKLLPKDKDNKRLILKKAFILERLAYFLRRENKPDKGLQYLQTSLDLKRKAGETYTLAYTHSQIAWMWMYQFEYEKTKANLDSAYILSKKYKNLKEEIRTLSRYGITYLNLKDYNKAEEHYLEAVRLADSINDPILIPANNANYADFLKRRGRYEESVPYLERAIDLHSKNNNQIGLESSYFLLGYVYRKSGKPYKSIESYKKAVEMSKELKSKALIHTRYKALSYAYLDIKDYKNAFLSMREYTIKKDTAINEKNYKKMADISAQYQYEKRKAIDSVQFTKEKREVELIAYSESAKKRLYFLLLVIAIIAAGGIGFLMRRMYLGKTQVALERLEKEKAQKELLDQKVIAKEEEIKRLVADNTMRLNFKQDLLEQLNKELSERKPEDLKASLSSLTKELKSQIGTEGKLSSLQNKIDEVNQGFDAKLIKLYPELTKTEREVCSLLRLNLSIKEIMTIRNASQDAVKSVRYRIRKKIGLSAKEELEQFIQSL